MSDSQGSKQGDDSPAKSTSVVPTPVERQRSQKAPKPPKPRKVEKRQKGRKG
jgi:hypothetical protein